MGAAVACIPVDGWGEGCVAVWVIFSMLVGLVELSAKIADRAGRGNCGAVIFPGMPAVGRAPKSEGRQWSDGMGRQTEGRQ